MIVVIMKKTRESVPWEQVTTDYNNGRAEWHRTFSFIPNYGRVFVRGQIGLVQVEIVSRDE